MVVEDKTKLQNEIMGTIEYRKLNQSQRFCWKLHRSLSIYAFTPPDWMMMY